MSDAPDRDLQAEIERYKEEVRELRDDVRDAERDAENACESEEIAEKNFNDLQARISTFLDTALVKHPEINTGAYLEDPFVRALADLMGWYQSSRFRSGSRR